jgi:uncharacterized protein YdeI (YjbR/CyaY-like superfamily)
VGEPRFFATNDELRAWFEAKQRKAATVEPDDEARFRSNGAAWAWFEARPASYRVAAIYWVVSAKKADTRARRLATIIEDSAANRAIRSLAPRGQPG